jgi:hypothetical protein
LITFQDDFQLIKGIHQFNLGVWFQPLRDNEDTASRQLGQASFTSLMTFLQGTTSSFQVVPNPSELGWRSFFGAWYAEDVMKLRRNLTVRVGLRYEFTNGWNEVDDRASNYITNGQGVLETTPLVGKSLFTTNNATHLLGPRVGLAWDPFGDGKTAIRSGYGMYYSLIDDLSFLVNSLPPYNGTASYANVAAVHSADCLRRAARPIVRTRGVGAVHHLCPGGRPTECKDTSRERMELHRGAPTDQRHGAADRLCRLVWLPRIDQHRPQ